MRIISLIFISILLSSTALISQKPNETEEEKTMRMQWFKDAKLGIFIHWGIYAVKGIDESWSFYNHMLSYEDYMDQCNGFTAVNYEPEQWATLFKESGAR